MTAPSPDTGTRLTLVDEIQRYLVVVDTFTALGAQPTWVREAPPAEVNAERRSSDGLGGQQIASPARGDG